MAAANWRLWIFFENFKDFQGNFETVTLFQGNFETMTMFAGAISFPEFLQEHALAASFGVNSLQVPVPQPMQPVPQAVPMQTMPLQQQGVPMQTVPVQQQVPMPTMPVQQQGVPMQTMPVRQQAVPMQTMPVQQQGVPMQTMPVQQQAFMDSNVPPWRATAAAVPMAPATTAAPVAQQPPLRHWLQQPLRHPLLLQLEIANQMIRTGGGTPKRVGYSGVPAESLKATMAMVALQVLVAMVAPQLPMVQVLVAMVQVLVAMVQALVAMVLAAMVAMAAMVLRRGRRSHGVGRHRLMHGATCAGR